MPILSNCVPRQKKQKRPDIFTEHMSLCRNKNHNARHFVTKTDFPANYPTLFHLTSRVFTIRNVKEIDLESLRDLNFGLDKSNFRRDMVYRA